MVMLFNELQFTLVAPLFKLLAWAFDMLMGLTKTNEFDQITSFTDSIYVLVGVFVLFRLAISMLNYLINPDSFSDKSTGGGKLLTRIITSMILIVASPFVFGLLADLQSAILDDGIIFRIIKLNESGDMYVTTDKPEEECGATSGTYLAKNAISAFIDGNDDKTDSLLLAYFYRASSDDCKNGDGQKALDHQKAITEVEELFNDKKLEIDFLIALIASIGIVAFILIMAIDIIVRYLKLLLLQMISPVAFVSHMNPKDKIFDQWLKNYGSVYADLFIKIIAVAFLIILINFVTELNVDGFGMIFYILGVLVFAKTVPSFISKIFGIDGAGSFKESAGMLKKGLGFGAGAAALALGAGFAAHKANKADRQQRINKSEDFKSKWKSAEGAKGKAKALLSGAGRAAVQSGRAAKMVSTSAIKGAGAGFQGKGISSAFSGTIAEGDNLATAIEGGATFKQRAFAGVNKTFGTDIGGLSKAKEKKEALDELSKKQSELKSKIKEEMYKKNTAGIAESLMKLDAMEQANKDGNYVRVLAEMGYKVETNSDGKTICSKGDKSFEVGVDDRDIADAARSGLAQQRTAHADREKATIQAVINGEYKYKDKDGISKTEDVKILSSTPELQKLAQEVEEAAAKAVNSGYDAAKVTADKNSKGETVKLHFGSDVVVDFSEEGYYQNGGSSSFKSHSDAVISESQKVATELQQSGAGAARTYQENKNKK